MIEDATVDDGIRDYRDIETGYQAVRWNERTLYEQSRPGSVNDVLPMLEPEIEDEVGDPLAGLPSTALRATPPALPEVAEPEIVRHYIRLSQMTFGYDVGNALGLGTCSMKYSPKIDDRLAALPQIANIHPLQPDETIQGILEVLHGMREWLCELGGMDEISFQPRGGGHGAFTDACMIRAYHAARGDTARDEIITCAVSHPCNPATASAAGFKVISLYPDEETGDIGIDAVRAAISERTAGIMFSAPYDTGVFDSQIAEYARLVHEAGGLVSLDQANFNGVMTRMRAGDLGADMVHFNLHKTFSTPHGSYGPGAGAVGVKAFLRDFLPVPIVERDADAYRLRYDLPRSIGRVGMFHGVVPNVVRAYAWTLAMGVEGLRQASEWAVINNNYLIGKLLDVRGVGISWANRAKLQEARFSLEQLRQDTGVTTGDVNYRLGDFGMLNFHESHVPRIIPEPVTPEPTESISRSDIDAFVAAFQQISDEAYAEPDIVRTAPHRGQIGREIHDYENLSQVPFTWRAWQRRHG